MDSEGMTRFHPSTPLRCYLTYALLATTQQVAEGNIFTWLSPDGSTVFSDRLPIVHCYPLPEMVEAQRLNYPIWSARLE